MANKPKSIGQSTVSKKVAFPSAFIVYPKAEQTTKIKIYFSECVILKIIVLIYKKTHNSNEGVRL